MKYVVYGWVLGVVLATIAFIVTPNFVGQIALMCVIAVFMFATNIWRSKVSQ